LNNSEDRMVVGCVVYREVSRCRSVGSCS